MPDAFKAGLAHRAAILISGVAAVIQSLRPVFTSALQAVVQTKSRGTAWTHWIQKGFPSPANAHAGRDPQVSCLWY